MGGPRTGTFRLVHRLPDGSITRSFFFCFSNHVRNMSNSNVNDPGGHAGNPRRGGDADLPASQRKSPGG